MTDADDPRQLPRLLERHDPRLARPQEPPRVPLEGRLVPGRLPGSDPAGARERALSDDRRTGCRAGVGRPVLGSCRLLQRLGPEGAPAFDQDMHQRRHHLQREGIGPLVHSNGRPGTTVYRVGEECRASPRSRMPARGLSMRPGGVRAAWGPTWRDVFEDGGCRCSRPSRSSSAVRLSRMRRWPMPPRIRGRRKS